MLSGCWQPLHQVVYQSGGKVEFTRRCSLFLASFESSNSSISMERNDKLYGFSAVKVTFVDSLI